MRLNFVWLGRTIEAQGVVGERLLDAARRAAMPLEGTCNGDLACATCHVRIPAADRARLPDAREEEEDMLDLVRDATRDSRLACQIVLDASLDGLSVHVPD